MIKKIVINKHESSELAVIGSGDVLEWNFLVWLVKKK